MEKYLILAFGMFLTGFIDSIAGGGGLISIPVFMFTGLPIKSSIATNKLAAFFGNFISAFNYYKRGQLDKKLILKIAPLGFLGAFIGAYILRYLSSDFLKLLLPIVLFLIFIYSTFNKRIGMSNNFVGYNKKNLLYGALLSLSLGFYNGFFGPATGTLLTIGLITIYKFDFLKATGTTQALNFFMTVSSLIGFLIVGGINLKYGIVASIFRSLGGRLGSNLAISKGNSIIKPLFLSSILTAMLVMVYREFLL